MINAPEIAVEGETVLLSATDSEGDINQYTWEQTAGAVTLELVGANTDSAAFEVPALSDNHTVTLSLTVENNTGETDTASTAIQLQPAEVTLQAPTADAGEDSSVTAGETATLDATASSDEDGEILAYAWEQTEGPSVSLTNAVEAVASFTAPEVEETTVLTFSVTVTDNDGLTDSDSVMVTVEPEDNSSGDTPWPAIVADNDDILFVGNSLIGSRGGMQGKFATLLQESSLQYQIDIHVPGSPSESGFNYNNGFFYGSSLTQIYGAQSVHDSITDGSLDTVVMISGGSTTMMNFYNLIAPTGARMVVHQTWGWPNNPTNVSWTQFRNNIQAVVNQTRNLENNTNTIISPTGYVFYELTVNPIDGAQGVDYLFDPDGDNHQNVLGNLVGAYVLYSTMTGLSPQGLDISHITWRDYITLTPTQVTFSDGIHPDITYSRDFLHQLQARIWQLVQNWKSGSVTLSPAP